MKLICRHCERYHVTRPRGLCWRCWHAPGVRGLYGPASKCGRRGAGLGRGPHPLPPSPTTAAPGTPEKLAVLAERARKGVRLFHPADARFEGDPRHVVFLQRRRAVDRERYALRRG